MVYLMFHLFGNLGCYYLCFLADTNKAAMKILGHVYVNTQAHLSVDNG